MADVSITAESFENETELAILIMFEGKEIWLPKSKISYEGQPGDKDIDIVLPQWLAEDKEIV